ncbi:unnamed protein product, partial [Prorocentrum cordatum]
MPPRAAPRPRTRAAAQNADGGPRPARRQGGFGAAVQGGAASAEPLSDLRTAWAEACCRGDLCFRDPQLAALAASAVGRLGRPPAAAAHSGARPSHALAAALVFPPGGGVALDPELALAPDFFELGGLVRAALPDFLADRAWTGRIRLPSWRLAELLQPPAESWQQLAGQVAELVEQVAWLLIDPMGRESKRQIASLSQPVAALGDAQAAEHGGCPAKTATRRQRKRAVAIRREAALGLGQAAFRAPAGGAAGCAEDTSCPRPPRPRRRPSHSHRPPPSS